MKLETYLNFKYATGTAKIYLFDIRKYLEYTSNAEVANYNDILDYIEHLRRIYDNPRTISRILSAVKAYYFYLVHTAQRDDHPCRYLKLKDAKNKPLQLQDLLTKEELQLLTERKERYKQLEMVHKVIISLLTNQALTTGEITRLTTGDINLIEANIRIKASKKLNARTLPLEASQVMLLHQYLEKDRKKLLKDRTEILILSKTGKPLQTDSIHYLATTLEKILPGRKIHPGIIRQSVIASLLKEGKDLRKVQVFAGHKKISTTEKYKPSTSETLLKELDKYHPLR